MGPKIDAAIQFLEGGGKRVMIGRLEEVLPVLRGHTGTHIVAG
jgi:carbamate kinase